MYLTPAAINAAPKKNTSKMSKISDDYLEDISNFQKFKFNLDYENYNSLIRYPFLDNVESIATPYIANNVFTDFQFVDFTNTVKRVYISRIVNVLSTSLTIYLNDGDALTLIDSFVIAASDLVNHVGNLSVSYVSKITANYSIKISFGEGILNFITSSFDTTYSLVETEFSPTTVVLYHPVVTQVNVSY
jgi:hypothetical protein